LNSFARRARADWALDLQKEKPVLHQFVTTHRNEDQKVDAENVERSGHVAHEMRNAVNTALLAFHVLRDGSVPVTGSVGTVLGRSLMDLRDLVDSAVSTARLEAGVERRERLAVATFLDEVAVVARLHAKYRGIHLSVVPAPPTLEIVADPQLLASALSNLLNNAFKYSRPGGHVALRAHAGGGRVVLEVEDQCGGIPDTKRDLFRAFGERTGSDRTGLGLGLFIARKAVHAHGGRIHVRNMPGTGCVFIIDLPLAAAESAPPESA
jgi:signal transduction histidine kinase